MCIHIYIYNVYTYIHIYIYVYIYVYTYIYIDETIIGTPKRTSPGAVVACKESTCFLRKSAFGRWNLHLSRHWNLRHGIACASVRNCVLFAACNLHSRMVMTFHDCHDSGAKWKIAEGASSLDFPFMFLLIADRTNTKSSSLCRCFKGQARTGIFEPWHGIPPISPWFPQHLRLHRSRGNRGNRANALRSSSGSSMSSGSKSSLLEANGPLMALVSNVGGDVKHPPQGPPKWIYYNIRSVLNPRFLAVIFYIRGKD